MADDIPPYPWEHIVDPPMDRATWRKLQEFRQAEAKLVIDWRRTMKGPYWFLFCTCRKSAEFVPGEPVFAECQVHGAFTINHKGEVV